VEDYIEANRRHWDELVPHHVRSEFYDVASFKAGRSTLMPVERQELGDVRGKTLLHLQCHFGMDTLSWAREGATVTGVDFSPEAVRVARELARELGIDARFVDSDVYRLREALTGSFDIVFASYGVVCWLPDFARWAEIAASFVRAGGIFYLVDDHPLAGALADESATGNLRLDFPYLAGEAISFEADGSYASDAALTNRRTFEFAHGLGEIVTALADAGLRLEYLHEFPFCSWQRLRSMQRGDDGYWRLPGDETRLPFLFSVKATKPKG
jgi:SAM-dependent methyltransferase